MNCDAATHRKPRNCWRLIDAFRMNRLLSLTAVAATVLTLGVRFGQRAGTNLALKKSSKKITPRS